MRLILVLILLSIPSISWATKACRQMEYPDFKKSIIASSEVIVIGKITDYSNTTEPNQWTKLEVVKIFKGRLASKSFYIANWQAKDMPMYDFKKGGKILAFLKKNNETYRFTDNSWVKCTPSIGGVIDQKLYLSYKGSNQITFKDFEKELKK